MAIGLHLFHDRLDPLAQVVARLMARRLFTAGVLVLTTMALTAVAGAALGIHAAAEGGPADAQSTPPAEDTPTVAQPEPTPEPAYGVVWDKMAQCEASSDWHNARNPIYKGGLQFDAATWARYGGLAFAARADFATRGQQILVAERTLQSQGWGAWPVCSRVIGVR